MDLGRRITKRKIAEIQLCRAVQLLADENDPISALTLAGAAEEILGKIAKSRGHKTSFEESVAYTRSICEFLSKTAKNVGEPYEIPNQKVIERHQNRIRNELKHNDKGKDVRVQAHFEIEAEEMIFRAIKNYFRIYGRVPKNKRLEEWWSWTSL